MKETKNKRKIFFLFFTVVILLLLVWFVIYSYHLYQKKVETESGFQMSEIAQDVSSEGVIAYQGKTYERNPSIKAILCIGVDTAGEMEQKVSGGGGQADGLFVAAYDVAKDKVEILMIPRDTMTAITLTDLSGNVLGKDKQHITLAYAYGDGRKLSCERTAEAVSELLSGLEIDGYLAMNTSMISQLNDLAGGVTVSIETDSLAKREPTFVKGNTVTLQGKQAETFVRYRDITVDHSALERMSRQKQYMESYFEAIRLKVASDDQAIVRLMNVIETQMVTNMSKDQYLNMGLAITGGKEPFSGENIMTIPGEGITTELFDEFHHDPDGTRQMVLELFYREQQ